MSWSLSIFPFTVTGGFRAGPASVEADAIACLSFGCVGDPATGPVILRPGGTGG